MELFSSDKRYDFLSLRYYAYVVSLALVALSFYVWFDRGESKYGLDYMGGHEFVVRITGEAGSEKVRDALDKEGLKDATVQSFELGSDEYSIRLGSQEESGVVKQQVQGGLRKAFGEKAEILKADFIGPTVGKELRRQALIAAIVAMIGMLIYIAYRFEMSFAVGAVVAIMHDVIVATGVYLLCGHYLNMTTLAAALTIAGYSVNDTIVIYDRIREEVLKRPDEKLEDVINYSLSVTLNRTVITSLLTWFSALGLYLFGGGAVSDLSLFFLAGIIAGSFSTIYVASPVALAWADWSSRREAKAA
jgi:preprotein translocase SecF subunit